MFKVRLHLKEGNETDSFYWEMKYLPRKGDFFTCQRNAPTYEVDKVFLHCYDVDNDCDAEIFAHQSNK